MESDAANVPHLQTISTVDRRPVLVDKVRRGDRRDEIRILCSYHQLDDVVKVSLTIDWFEKENQNFEMDIFTLDFVVYFENACLSSDQIDNYADFELPQNQERVKTDTSRTAKDSQTNCGLSIQS